MDINQSESYFDANKGSILNLFKTYQMIEILLFMNLYFPIIDKELTLEKASKEVNEKTLGKLKIMYLSQHPNDELNIKVLLEAVTKQRNVFMHSLWINMGLMSKKDFDEYANRLLDDFKKNANLLLDKIMRFKVTFE